VRTDGPAHGGAFAMGGEGRPMAGSVLVAHATKRGSTQEVAEAVAAALRERGLDVEVEPAARVEDVRAYDGVVIGGALYRGRWHRGARRLLKRQHAALATRPVAVFGMGPRRNEDEAFARSRGQLERALGSVVDVRPSAVAVFGGVDREKGVDLRDWDAIRAWADEFGTGLADGA